MLTFRRWVYMCLLLTWFLVCCCALSLLLGWGVSVGMGPIGVGCKRKQWSHRWAFKNKSDAAWQRCFNKKRFEEVYAKKQTHEWLADPVVLIIEDVAVPVEKIGEEFSQVIVIRFFEEVQSSHVSQIGGHLFCIQG